jgi:hypothetical protein
MKSRKHNGNEPEDSDNDLFDPDQLIFSTDQLANIIENQLEGFDPKNAELALSALINLEKNIDAETFTSLLNNNELLKMLMLKLSDSDLQIRHAAIHAVNRLLGLGTILHLEKLMTSTLNFKLFVTILIDQLQKSYSEIFDGLRKGLFVDNADNLQTLKRLLIVINVSLSTIQRAVLVNFENPSLDAENFGRLVALFGQLIAECSQVDKVHAEITRLFERNVIAFLELLSMINENFNPIFNGIFADASAAQGLCTLLRGQGRLKLETFKLVTRHDAYQHLEQHMSFSEFEQIKNAVFNELESFIGSGIDFMAPILAFDDRHKQWVQSALSAIDLLIFLTDCHESDFEDLEVQKSKQPHQAIDLTITRFVSPAVFNFLLLILQKSVGQLRNSHPEDTEKENEQQLQEIPNTDDRKKAKFAFKVEDLAINCLELYLSLLSYSKAYNIVIDVHELLTHLHFFEANISTFAIVESDENVSSAKFVLDVFKCVNFLFEEFFKNEVNAFKDPLGFFEKVCQLLKCWIEMINQRIAHLSVLSEGQVGTAYDTYFIMTDAYTKNAEEIICNIVELFSKGLTPSNIGKIGHYNAINVFLELFREFMSTHKSIIVLTAFLDAFIDAFADNNIDDVFYGSSTNIPASLAMIMNSVSKFFIENSGRLEETQREFIEETLSNLDGFLKYKQQNK